jgi:hypothetical protein
MSQNQPQPQMPLVPKEYAGQWIAWDQAHTRIIASGRTFEEVRNAAIAAGESDPLMDMVPSAKVRFAFCSSAHAA